MKRRNEVVIAADELHHMVCTTREVVRREVARQDTCVLTTRVLMEVLKRRGLASLEMAVMVLAYNTHATAWIQKHGRPESDDDFASLGDAGGYMVVCGTGRGRLQGGWDGHLIAIVGPYLVDCTLDQFSRPHRQINLEPLVSPAPRRFRKGRCAGEIFIDGQLVTYEASGDTRYRQSADWTCDASELIDAVEASLALKAAS